MSILDNIMNTSNAIKRGYIEVTQEEYDLLIKELPKLETTDTRDIFGFGGATCLFNGIRFYVKKEVK